MIPLYITPTEKKNNRAMSISDLFYLYLKKRTNTFSLIFVCFVFIR